MADRQVIRAGDEPDAVILDDLDHVVSTVGDAMDGLLGAAFLVTGSGGFLGRSIVESVLRYTGLGRGRSCTLTLLTSRPDVIRRRYASEVADGYVKVIPWGPGFTTGLDDLRFDYIVHAAAPADQRAIRDQPVESLHATVAMAESIAQVAAVSPLRGAVLVSSGAVYGRQPDNVESLVETSAWSDPTDPVSTYAEGKRASEELWRRIDKDVKIARVFSALGP